MIGEGSQDVSGDAASGAVLVEGEEERARAAARILELLPLLMRRWSHEQRDAQAPRELKGGLADVHALRILMASGRTTAGEFARALWISDSAATGIINRLEASGVVARERESRDRRVVHLTVTDRGREVLAEATALRDTQIRRWFKELTASEVAQLVVLFEKLTRSVAEDGPTPFPLSQGGEP